jgi:hypothetical protein
MVGQNDHNYKALGRMLMNTNPNVVHPLVQQRLPVLYIISMFTSFGKPVTNQQLRQQFLGVNHSIIHQVVLVVQNAVDSFFEGRFHLLNGDLVAG